MVEFTLNNVAKIKSATIRLSGITIITGENDSGKSTIGKSLFSIIKADNIAKYKLLEFQFDKIKEHTNDLIKHLIQTNPILIKYIPTLDGQKEKYLKLEKTKKVSFLRSHIDKIRKLSYDINDKKSNEIIESMNLWLNNNFAFINRRQIELYNQIIYNFGSIDDFVNFSSQNSSLILKHSKSNINYYSIQIDKMKREIIFNDELPISEGRRFRPFTEATFIETPLIMNLLKFFMLERDKVNFTYPFILRDLARNLLKSFNKHHINYEKTKETIDNIKHIINGEFIVDNGEVKYLLNNNEINMFNVATGIKSFGILLLLLQNGIIKDSGNLLIVDEPEVHLHPKWQQKYALILYQIFKNLDTKIVITTHSPYIIDSFEKIQKIYLKDDPSKINFYLIKNGKSELINANNLTKVYALLGEPLWKDLS